MGILVTQSYEREAVVEMLGEKDIPKIVDCDILAFPHARYPPLGERAPEQMTAVCVIMLPICL